MKNTGRAEEGEGQQEHGKLWEKERHGAGMGRVKEGLRKGQYRIRAWEWPEKGRECGRLGETDVHPRRT